MHRFAVLLIFLGLLSMAPARAQSSGEVPAALIKVGFDMFTENPATTLKVIQETDLSSGAPEQRVELRLLGADLALRLKKLQLAANYLEGARRDIEGEELPLEPAATFVFYSLKQQLLEHTAPGPARDNLARSLDATFRQLDQVSLDDAQLDRWILLRSLLGRSLAYWMSSLAQYQTGLGDTGEKLLVRVKSKAEELSLQQARARKATPTLILGYAYLDALAGELRFLDSQDPLLSYFQVSGLLDQLVAAAQERGLGAEATELLNRVRARVAIDQARRLIKEADGRTYTEEEGARIRQLLAEIQQNSRSSASYRLAAEFFVTSFSGSFSSRKPGWEKVAERVFLSPPDFLAQFPELYARYLTLTARFHALQGRLPQAESSAAQAVRIYQNWVEGADQSYEGLAFVRRDARAAFEELVSALLAQEKTEEAFKAALAFHRLEGATLLSDSSLEIGSSGLAGKLEAGQAFVQLFPGERHLFSFLVTPQKTVAASRKVKYEELRRRVVDLSKDLSRFSPSQRERGEIFRLLFGDFEKELLRQETIFIAPSSALTNLPWAALLTGDKKPLVGGNRVQLVFSKGSLEQSVGPKSELFGLGNPDGSLPAAEEEVKALARLFPGALVAVGSEANKSFLSKYQGGYLHFATHGAVNFRKPEESFLVLGKGGRLTAAEASELTGVNNLVVLSACQTAVSPVDGVGVRSLSGAFLEAGAPLVLGTLWRVDDESSRRLMESFYQGLKEGKGPATALAEAQNKLRGSAKFSDPYYWSGYVLFGR